MILHAGGRIDLVGRFDFESFLLAWVLFASSTNFMSVEKTGKIITERHCLCSTFNQANKQVKTSYNTIDLTIKMK